VNGFDGFLAATLVQGEREAREGGSATVEAHHLLLALATDRESATQHLLASAGLDRPTIRAALEREFEQSLAVAGVSLAAGVPPSRSVPEGSPELGASAKLAIERGVGSAGRRRELRPAHLLLGILQARVGTVPRALDLAGVDRAGLVERVRWSLAAEGGSAAGHDHE
jgi:D-alanyl-D-alanine carboxypeptidase